MHNKLTVEPNAWILDGNKIVFSDKYSRSFYYMDIETGSISYIGDVQDVSSFTSCLYYECVKMGNKSIFIPHHADSLAIYDSENESISSVNLPEQLRNNLGKFSCGCVIDDKVYMFGFLSDKVVSYDLTANSFSEQRFIEESIASELLDDKKKGFYICGAVSYGQNLYFVSSRTNVLFCADLNTKCCEKIGIDIDCEGFCSMILFMDKIVIIPNKGSDIIVYDMTEKVERKKRTIDKDMILPFRFGVKYRNKLVLIPYNYSDIGMFSLDDSAEDSFNSFKKDEMNMFGRPIIYKDFLYTAITDKRRIMRYDLADRTTDYYDTTAYDLPLELFDPKKKTSDGVVLESDNYGLNEYIIWIKQ